MIDISVVVVTVAQGPLLDRCLSAIAADPSKPRQVIVVDQGPTALRERLDSALAGSGIRLSHIRIGPSGVSAARNAGIAVADSEWIAFTDDDCVPRPGWLASLIENAERNGSDFAAGRVLPLEDGRPDTVAVSSRTDTRERMLSAPSAMPWEVGTGGNLVVRREALIRVGCFSELFGPGARFRAAEDVELIERLLERGAVACYAPAGVVLHEMKERRGRIARRYPYGYGMGALVARAGPRRRRRLARAYIEAQIRATVGGLRRGRMLGLAELALLMAGFAAGAAAACASSAGRPEELPRDDSYLTSR